MMVAFREDTVVRLAWFSPLPPSTSGIAAYSAEILPFVRRRHQVDVFVENPSGSQGERVHGAHDYVWMARKAPYDLSVYQMGNAGCHDYMWAYMFRYRGLLVLHDAQLHQARALFLTRRWKPRRDDYLAEFRACHPDAPADAGLLVAAGLGGSLYHHWPMVKLAVESARLTAVHNRRLMLELSEQHPSAAIEAIEMGVGDPVPATGNRQPAADALSAGAVRDRLGIPHDAVVVSAFGGLTPEKRIPALLAAVGALAAAHPRLHVLLVGARAEHYDVDADVARYGLGDRVHVAGFVADSDLPGYLAASDICVCLRWPTNRETSASWVRCLAAGRATIVSDLVHLLDVPALDPRDWRVLDAASGGGRRPLAVAVDVLDEEHSLRLALDRLGSDASLRAGLGSAARRHWEAHHRLEAMADAYERLLLRAQALEPPRVHLPTHLVEDGSSHARQLLAPLGIEIDL
jgi:glycosyltransferase involved in cell wall biosynthesis